MKTKNCFNVNRAVDLSYLLGQAIAGACDERLAGFGLPLGDFEIALEEGTISPLQGMRKEKGDAPTYGEELPGEKPSGERHYTAIRKRMKGGFSELKKLLTTDWAEQQDDLIDS